MANFSHLTTNTNVKAIRGGYKDVFYFCPIADFTTIAKPLAIPLALGDQVLITDDHTFTGTKGFFHYEAKQRSVTIKGVSTGDIGAKLMEYTGEITLLGDSASTQEQLERLLNSHVICLVKDANCLVDDVYAQLGDECNQPEFIVEFDGKTTNEGLKEYKVSFKVVASKYRYEGAVVSSTA